MTLKEMINHCKSCRQVTGKPVDAESFRFFKAKTISPVPGHGYSGSLII